MSPLHTEPSTKINVYNQLYVSTLTVHDWKTHHQTNPLSNGVKINKTHENKFNRRTEIFLS